MRAERKHGFVQEKLDIVETELKETRFGKQHSMSLEKFLKNYQKKKGNNGLYSVAEIPVKMKKKIPMPSFFASAAWPVARLFWIVYFPGCENR